MLVFWNSPLQDSSWTKCSKWEDKPSETKSYRAWNDSKSWEDMRRNYALGYPNWLWSATNSYWKQFLQAGFREDRNKNLS